MEFLQTNPQAGRSMPYVLGKTLGKKLDSVHLASLWGMLQGLPASFQALAEGEGFKPGPNLGEDLFKAILEKPQGLWVASVDPRTWNHFQALTTEDGRINLDVPEMAQWLKEIEPAAEAERLREDADRFPLIMSSGRHWDVNANSQMRDPEWNKGKRACTLTMHPKDAERFSLSDGQMVKVTTEAGEEIIELELTEMTRPGYVVIPHGFGLVHQGKTYGANANRLAKNTHRDPIAGTPLHRYIRCRVEGA
jgi:anaerobic selenocysteine-containing dehydrogenase